MTLEQDRSGGCGSMNLLLNILDYFLKIYLGKFYICFSLWLQTALVLTTWSGYVCNFVLGCGPGSVIHVYEHSWNIHQLPVGPGSTPSLPGDTEVCGGQAASGNRKPKTGTNWEGLVASLSPSQSLNYMELFFSPNTSSPASVPSTFVSWDSGVWNSYIRLTG